MRALEALIDRDEPAWRFALLPGQFVDAMVDRVPGGAHTLVDHVARRAHPFVNRVAGRADSVVDSVTDVVHVLTDAATVGLRTRRALALR